MRGVPRGLRISGRTVIWSLVVVILVDLGACVAGTAAGGYEILAVQRQTQRLSLSSLSGDVSGLRSRLDIAAAAFAVARACWWPWRLPAAALAAVGGPLRPAAVVGPLLDIAADGSGAGAQAANGLAPVLASLHQGRNAGGDAGARLLAGLQRGRGALQAALSGLTQTGADWHALDLAALPASLRTRLEPVGRRLPTAGEALQAAVAAPDLLGATRPRYYLIVPENPWDLRATGGFVGTAVLLEADHGRPTLAPRDEQRRRQHTGRPSYVPPPLPLLHLRALRQLVLP